MILQQRIQRTLNRCHALESSALLALHQGRIKRDHDLSLTGQLIQHRFHGAAGIEYERNA
jgi:hypothetical protein